MVSVHRSAVEPSFDRVPVPRIGMIALSTDLTSERDAAAVLPPQVALHVTRVPFDNPTTPATLLRLSAHLTEAAGLLIPRIELSAIVFSCTAASVTIGDRDVALAINASRPGVPVVTPAGAAVRAFARLGVRRIALLTPYLPETTAPMVAYFSARGLDVVKAQCLGLADDREMARVSADTIVAAGVAVDAADADAVFLSCTALPALSVVEALEARLGKPVVTSNQASLWHALRLAGVAQRGPGRLFDDGGAVVA